MPKPQDRIRELNDQLRCRHIGGIIVVTDTLQAMGAAFITAVDEALTAIKFNTENDPHHKHDFGVVTIYGTRVLFKIDYYDLSRCFASPDPADETRTCRVMTIMLAEEY